MTLLGVLWLQCSTSRSNTKAAPQLFTRATTHHFVLGRGLVLVEVDGIGPDDRVNALPVLQVALLKKYPEQLV